MSRRSARLAQLRLETTRVPEVPHILQVLQYYEKVLENVRDPNERANATISALEFVFQSWPTLSTEIKQTIYRQTKELELCIAEMNEVLMCKKLRLTLLLQAIQTLM